MAGQHAEGQHQRRRQQRQSGYVEGDAVERGDGACQSGGGMAGLLEAPTEDCIVTEAAAHRPRPSSRA